MRTVIEQDASLGDVGVLGDQGLHALQSRHDVAVSAVGKGCCSVRCSPSPNNTCNTTRHHTRNPDNRRSCTQVPSGYEGWVFAFIPSDYTQLTQHTHRLSLSANLGLGSLDDLGGLGLLWGGLAGVLNIHNMHDISESSHNKHSEVARTHQQCARSSGWLGS